MDVKDLVHRLDRFQMTWLANPAAKLEFTRLIEAARNNGGVEPPDDIENQIDDWIAEQVESLASIGVTDSPREGE